MSKRNKRILLIGAVVIGLIAILGIEVAIERTVKSVFARTNEQIDGSLTYDGLNVQFITTFPKIRTQIHDLNLYSSSQEEMLHISNLSASIGLFSLFRVPKVHSLEVTGGHICLYEEPEGRWNFEILQPTEGSQSLKNFILSMVTIESLDISIHSEYQSKDISLSNLTYKGSISRHADQWTTSNHFETNMKVSMSKLLADYEVILSSDFNAVFIESSRELNLTNGILKLNEFPIEFSGKLEDYEQSFDYNLEFASASTEVGHFLSLAPWIYQYNYDQLNASGRFQSSGRIEGNTRETYPKYEIDASLSNGSFWYSNRGKKVDLFEFEARLLNSQYHSVYSALNISSFGLHLGESKAEGSVSTIHHGETPILDINSVIDIHLSDISDAFYSENTGELSGRIQGFIEDRYSPGQTSLTPSDGRNILLTGSDIVIDDLRYPRLTISKWNLQSDPNQIQMKMDQLEVKDLTKGSIIIEVQEDFVHSNQIADPVFSLNANLEYLNLNSLPNQTSGSGTYIWKGSNEQLKVDVNTDILTYDSFEIIDSKLNGTISDSVSWLSYSIGDLNGNQLFGNGQFSNLPGFLLNSKFLTGTLSVASPDLDIDTMMKTESGIESSFLFPANMRLVAEFDTDNLRFKNTDLAKAIGKWSLDRGVLHFQTESQFLGGELSFSGHLDDRSESDPILGLTIQANDLSFSEVVRKVDIFSSFVPLSPFLDGRFNTSIQWESLLDDNYLPVLETLNSYGLIETINGRIDGFLPIDSLTRFISNIELPGSWAIADTKKWFVVEDGRVIVDEIRLSKGPVDVILSGSHSFEHELDYKVVISHPVSEHQWSTLVDKLRSKLPFQWSPVTRSTVKGVDLIYEMKGTATHPTFKLINVRLQEGKSEGGFKDRLEEILVVLGDGKQGQTENPIDTLPLANLPTLDSLENDSLRLPGASDTLFHKARTFLDSLRNFQRDSIFIPFKMDFLAPGEPIKKVGKASSKNN